MQLREETPADIAAIREVNLAAFGGPVEADLVDRLRAEGYVITSLVALDDDDIVGHILFTHLPIDTEHGPLRGAALAPMAVTPTRQSEGIGSALVRRGLELCRERAVDVVVVLGHPEYYPRFGFTPEAVRDLKAPYSGEAFMARDLRTSPPPLVGTVHYPAPFTDL